MTDLARQLVEHHRWEWLDGMLLYAHVNGHRATSYRLGPELLAPQPWWLPDLDDYATQGVLLGMLREVSPWLMVEHYSEDDGTRIWSVSFTMPGGATETIDAECLGEALARALPTAWGGL